MMNKSSDIPRSERLSEIKIPTLIIAGAHDNIVVRTNYQNWANGITWSKMVVIPDSGHLVPIDQPEEFNQTVLEFLGNL